LHSCDDSGIRAEKATLLLIAFAFYDDCGIRVEEEIMFFFFGYYPTNHIGLHIIFSFSLFFIKQTVPTNTNLFGGYYNLVKALAPLG